MIIFPQDKANHIVYGAALAAIGSCYLIIVGALLCIAAAIGKEVWDWWQNQRGGRHGVEVMDAIATICGGALVLIPQIVKAIL